MGFALIKENIIDDLQMQEKSLKSANAYSLQEIQGLIADWLEEEHGRTLAQLASIAKTTESTLSRIQTGKTKRRPHRHTIDGLIRATKTTEGKISVSEAEMLWRQEIETRLRAIEDRLVALQAQLEVTLKLLVNPHVAGSQHRTR